MKIPGGSEADSGVHEFHDEEGPSIWAIGDDEQGVSEESRGESKEDIDQPSFLRRALRRGKKSDDDDPFDSAQGKQASAADDSDDNDDQAADEGPPENDESAGSEETPKAKKGKK